MTRNRQQMNRPRLVSQPAIVQEPTTTPIEQVKETTTVPIKSVHDRKFDIMRNLLRNGLPTNIFNPVLQVIWQQSTIEIDVRDADVLEALRYPFAGCERTMDYAVPSFLAIAANPIYLPVKVYNDKFPRGDERVEVFQHRKGVLLLERYYGKYREYLTNMNDLIKYINELSDEDFEEFEKTFYREYHDQPRIKL